MEPRTSSLVSSLARSFRPGQFPFGVRGPSRAAVDRFHAAARQFGGADGGAPGPWPHYGRTYYAAFVRDPDGYKLEAKYPPPERSPSEAAEKLLPHRDVNADAGGGGRASV